MGQTKIKMAGGREVTLKTSKAPKGAPRSKRPGANDSPARRKYWANGVLEKHKVSALMKHNGMTREEAIAHWRRARQGRLKK